MSSWHPRTKLARIHYARLRRIPRAWPPLEREPENTDEAHKRAWIMCGIKNRTQNADRKNRRKVRWNGKLPHPVCADFGAWARAQIIRNDRRHVATLNHFEQQQLYEISPNIKHAEGRACHTIALGPTYTNKNLSSRLPKSSISPQFHTIWVASHRIASARPTTRFHTVSHHLRCPRSTAQRVEAGWIWRGSGLFSMYRAALDPRLYAKRAAQIMRKAQARGDRCGRWVLVYALVRGSSGVRARVINAGHGFGNAATSHIFYEPTEIERRRRQRRVTCALWSEQKGTRARRVGDHWAARK